MKIRVASAGTGKTASLVLRYLELVASGTPLRRIAGVTFTRKAADELRVRVGEALEDVLARGRHLDFVCAPASRPRLEEAWRELPGATLATIHGFMIECLRRTAPLLSLDPDFSLIGDWEARALFEEEWRSLLYLSADPAHPLFGLLKPEMGDAVLHLFAKRSLAAAYTPSPGEENATLVKAYEAVFANYSRRLGSGVLSSSEVERKALELTANPRALKRILARYRIVLVDEFQDVNPLQGQFFRALEAAGLPVEAVGDPKQSIYAFRDADVEVFRRALAEGEVLPPLTTTYRHSQVLVRFLNRLTGKLAALGLGFGPEEAPPVQGARPVRGRLEVHWVEGEVTLDELRTLEAQILAQRLQALSERVDPSEMAVLVRSRNSFAFLEEALGRLGLPYVLLQGRGYYGRLEVRDLYHAITVALDPRGLSLAAWLRSPFGGLGLAEVEQVLRSADPLTLLQAEFPEVYARLRLIQQTVSQSKPLEALKFLVRAPILEGRAYFDHLEARSRENVDALLFQVAARPPSSLEVLLERLRLLSQQAEAGDVPQSGEGVQLLTVHAAKGLEWPVVAVFDLGRRNSHLPQPAYLGPDGAVALPETPVCDELRARAKAREEAESYRLLYVAASRAKDVLILTGSVRAGKPEGWAEVLAKVGFGPTARFFDRPDYVQRSWNYRPVPPSAPPAPKSAPVAPPWLERVFEPLPLPPLFSPSALKRQAEPLPLPDLEEGEEVPGRARALGTLVHTAIAQGWNPDHPDHLATLEAQEVMFPFDPAERTSILTEARELLRGYQALLGKELPWPRDEDYPELPLALPDGPTVWQGVIDRLYRVGEEWYLEDYKTDHEAVPERYHFQLALYYKAVREVWRVNPRVRLVFLRWAQVVELEPGVLERALWQDIPGCGYGDR
ncbi:MULTISPECIES: exodeoxyribonuclease V subunit beta [unclassified Meiothermus]|uniref:UvrD-helicase domain-containing protein n=1 Tax=unclassified Meiothermus TaxID=370471 RepID=UPI000D7BB5AE|nr:MULTISPECIES: UvrD-helicase domain-containing protein [unclassified Meiothermus]PZA08757.1 DNA helicase UvrD [Meiothermus sp. Pnk-1]RYM40621.1 DNA helicase UvrD [Meiothermus sp. PNK-Is4]